MTQHRSTKLDTLLVTSPVWPEEPVLAALRLIFPQVIYRPAVPTFDKKGAGAVDGDQFPSDEELAAADVILAFTVPENLTSIEQVPNLKLFQGLSAGTGHLEAHPFFKSLPESDPLLAASASGIHVSAISEHSVATVITLFHKLNELIVLGHNEKRWVNARAELAGGHNFIREIRGQTVGVAGYGHIGRETARQFAALGANITALTRSGKKAPLGGFIVPGTGDIDGSLPKAWYSTEDEQSLHEFYSTADVIVSTLPGTAALEKFTGKKAFESMKDDAIFVNIGRGTTVDQDALVTALSATEGPLKIGGASLDVTQPEPLPDNHPLWSLKNTIISPHTSGVSIHYFTLAAALLKENAERLRAGQLAFNVWRGKGE